MLTDKDQQTAQNKYKTKQITKRNQLQNKTNYKTKPDQQPMPTLNNTISIQNANTVEGHAAISVCNGVNQL